MNSVRRCLLLLSCALLMLLLPSCVGTGYDLQRYHNDRDNHALAARCAQGWSQGLTLDPGEKVDVDKALDAWTRRLDADAKALGVTK